MSKLKKLLLFSLLIVMVLFITLGIIIYVKNENMIAVLGYHNTVLKKNNGDGLTLDIDKFERQIKILKKLGYKSLSLDEFYCWKNKACKKPHKSVLITFDDGYYDNYKYAFNILKKYDMKATMFFVGELVLDENNKNYINKKDIKIINKNYPNIDLAAHTFALHNPNNKTYNEVDLDSKKMKELTKSKYFAYPHGIYNEEYIKALKDNGYKMAFTYGPSKEHRKANINDDLFKVPRLSISSDISDIKFILRIILPI